VTDGYRIRDFVESDRNFILSTWLRAFREAPQNRYVPTDIFYDRMQPIVWRVMSRHRPRIMCIADEPNHIVGWICGTQDLLAFLYVKRHSRGCGLAGRLLEDLGLNGIIRCTFWTAHAEQYAPSWRYRPSLGER